MVIDQLDSARRLGCHSGFYSINRRECSRSAVALARFPVEAPVNRFDAGIDALDCIRCRLSLFGEQIGYATITNPPSAFVAMDEFGFTAGLTVLSSRTVRMLRNAVSWTAARREWLGRGR